VKKTTIVVSSAIFVLFLWTIAMPQLSDPGRSGVFMRAMSEAKQVGIAAKVYADDHQGRLPEALEQLTPDYVPNDASFSRMILTTPGVLLKDLPPASVIAIKTAIDPKMKQTRVVLVHADISVELQK